MMSTAESMELVEEESVSKARKKLTFIPESKEVTSTSENQPIEKSLTKSISLNSTTKSIPKPHLKNQSCPFCQSKNLSEELIDHVKSCVEYR